MGRAARTNVLVLACVSFALFVCQFSEGAASGWSGVTRFADDQAAIRLRPQEEQILDATTERACVRILHFDIPERACSATRADNLTGLQVKQAAWVAEVHTVAVSQLNNATPSVKDLGQAKFLPADASPANGAYDQCEPAPGAGLLEVVFDALHLLRWLTERTTRQPKADPAKRDFAAGRCWAHASRIHNQGTALPSRYVVSRCISGTWEVGQPTLAESSQRDPRRISCTPCYTVWRPRDRLGATWCIERGPQLEGGLSTS